MAMPMRFSDGKAYAECSTFSCCNRNAIKDTGDGGLRHVDSWNASWPIHEMQIRAGRLFD